MRASPFTLCAALFLLFTTFTAAFPWPRFLPDVDSIIVRRADGGADATDQASSTQAPAKASATPTDSSSFDPDAQSQTVKVTGSMTITTGPTATGSSKTTGTNASDEDATSGSGSGSKSASGSKKSSSSKARTTTRKAYDARYPAGGITMISPAPTAAVTPLYKIGEEVAFKFSMTSCLQYPTAVNVLVTCTQNNALYTIAANTSFTEGKDKDVSWDTAQYGNTESMLTSEYTLIIYDADGGLEDIGESGYLAPFGNSRYPGFVFDMYEKRPYSDEPEGVKCATCSGATVEAVAKWLALGMGVAAVVGAHVL